MSCVYVCMWVPEWHMYILLGTCMCEQDDLLRLTCHVQDQKLNLKMDDVMVCTSAHTCILFCVLFRYLTSVSLFLFFVALFGEDCQMRYFCSRKKARGERRHPFKYRKLQSFSSSHSFCWIPSQKTS